MQISGKNFRPSWAERYGHLPAPGESIQDYLTVEDVAEKAGVSPRHVYKHYMCRPTPPRLTPDAYETGVNTEGKKYNQVYFTEGTADEFLAAVRHIYAIAREKFVTDRMPNARRLYTNGTALHEKYMKAKEGKPVLTK